ncbi:sodium channel subunit beta-1 isoform X4 [Salmo salar]|uniref:Sodium channel subunit beta-1 isoform X4 n=1 Tax=Salmo salar TaxID=8030 RepID=A0ABM3DLB0_SALSA|nr:sodium channel subunit beta-1 isoform X4 [Salmo salar]
MSAVQLLLVPLALWVLQASLCHGACVEVDSDTDAVVNEGFKLGCISCKMRAEVPAEATVEWSFMPKGESEFTKIYSYEDLMSDTPDERFYERLDWKGSKKTKDLQDGSIYILNVTWNDTGTYRCIFTRTLTFSSFKFHNDTTKIVHLNVVPRREALALGFTGDQGDSFHLVRGDDVCHHRWAAGMAGGGDDLLLQEDISARRGSIERERGGVLSYSFRE